MNQFERARTRAQTNDEQQFEAWVMETGRAIIEPGSLRIIDITPTEDPLADRVIMIYAIP